MNKQNTIIWIDGGWFLRCGGSLVPVRYLDAAGLPVRPPSSDVVVPAVKAQAVKSPG